MKKISEEFARELLDNIEGKFLDDDEFIMSETDIIKTWKQKGWIKKSRKINKEYCDEKYISLYRYTGSKKETICSKIDKDDYIIISDIQGNELKKIDLNLQSREEEIREEIEKIENSLKKVIGSRSELGYLWQLRELYLELSEILDNKE